MLIADHKAIRQYGIGFVKPTPVPLYAYLKSGYLIRGRTLKELAERTGVNFQNLTETVARYNHDALQGSDTAFGRGSTAWNRYNGDPKQQPNPCMRPLGDPPFYAVKIRMGDLGTLAGIATDAYARVLTQANEPVKG